jgi:hypothetical protein
MSELTKLIEENKGRFEIDKIELAKRVDFALATYDMVQPPINLSSPQHARLKKHYQTLQAMLIDSTDKLSNGYKLDMTNTRRTGASFTITFLKSEAEQTKDKSLVKKQVKQDYLAELEAAKQVWIKDLTANLAKEAELEAVVIAQTKTKAIQDELTALLANK